MIIVDEIEQGSPEWFERKCGIPSASKMNCLLKKNGERSDQRTKYLYQCAGERLTGKREETYQSAAMTRGIEMEPVARSVFEMLTEQQVHHVGFVFYDERCDRGCSPDGLIGDSSGLEIKCPSMAVHVGYLLANKLPSDYFQQVQSSLYFTKRETWWFFSYYPSLPPLSLKIERDEKFISALDAELDIFCAEIEAVVQKLRAMQ